MPNETALISTVAVSLICAFIGGFAATRLKLPAIVGYLVAGIVVGPFTPGFVADPDIADQLAEIGVIMLMFGVGMHFSMQDLLAVRRIALPGALIQIVLATLLGVALARWWNWPLGAGLVFGLALSVASTVVLLRALEAKGTLASENGRIATGWLVVEDLAAVIVLVLLPAVSELLGDRKVEHPGNLVIDLLGTIGLTLGKVALFVAIMLAIGTRFFPWLLALVDRTRSRELFTLATVVVALGIAFGAAELFHVSFALGAFFAGVVVKGSELSERVAAEVQPLQNAFAVLFFVSVGMLFDPAVLTLQPLRLLAVVAVIMAGKSLIAYGIVRAFRHTQETALTIAASLAQIGEFSFILAALGGRLGLLPEEGESLIVAGAFLSITLNPLAFRIAEAMQGRKKPPLGAARPEAEPARH